MQTAISPNEAHKLLDEACADYMTQIKRAFIRNTTVNELINWHKKQSEHLDHRADCYTQEKHKARHLMLANTLSEMAKEHGNPDILVCAFMQWSYRRTFDRRI